MIFQGDDDKWQQPLKIQKENRKLYQINIWQSLDQAKGVIILSAELILQGLQVFQWPLLGQGFVEFL